MKKNFQFRQICIFFANFAAMKTLIYGVIFTLITTIAAFFSGCSKNEDLPETPLAEFEKTFNDTIYKNPEAALQYADSILGTHTDSMTYHLVMSYKLIAHMMLSQTDSMDIYINHVKNYFTQNSDTSNAYCKKAFYNIANANGIWYSFSKQGDSAVYYLKKAIDYSNPSELPQSYLNLAENYVRQGMYVEGAESYRKALMLNDSIGNIIPKDFIYNGLAMTYMQISDYDQAEIYLNKSMEYFDGMHNIDRYVILNDFGNLYYFKGEYEKALPYFIKAYSYAQKMPNRNIDTYVPLFNQAEIYTLIHQPKKAAECIDTLKKVLAGGNLDIFEAHLRTLELALAIEQNDKAKATAVVQEMKHDQLPFELKRIRNRYLQTYYAEAGDFSNAYRLQSENRFIEDSLRNVQVKTRVADIYMRYQQDTTLIAKQHYISEQQKEIDRSNTLIILWTIIALVCGGLAITIYLLMRRQRQQMIERHIENIGKMRMENIRNCLSPHFTFNVLNHVISQYDENDPNRIRMMNLVKILRRCVEVSSQMTVSLSEEIDFVKTYVSLQCAQWKDDEFTFRCHIDDDIDSHSVVIPSMFIQIPVENAIKHGLRGIEGHRELNISIRSGNNGVNVEITNNGIGYKPKVMTSDTGKGMQVIYQTIMLLNRRNTEHIRFNIGQLNPENIGQEGTKVEIFFPSTFDFTRFERK